MTGPIITGPIITGPIMTGLAPDIILETRDVSRHFGSQAAWFGEKRVVRAVDGVSLAVRRGETLAVVGESGCGKSTLARLLVRLIRPTAGEVLYEGRDIGGLSEREMRGLRRDLQFVFQDPFSSLNPRMTVGTLVEEPLRVHGMGSRAERRRRVDALLLRVGLRPEFASASASASPARSPAAPRW
jgi:peptide/nickel transport system ATP-binding protein